MTDLVSVLAASHGESPFSTALVSKIYPDGTVDLTLSGGSALGVSVLASYAPRTGETVLVARRSPTDLVVLGALRTENATTIDVESAVTLAWNVTPSIPALANPFTVDPVATASHNGYGWVSDRLYQGAYYVGQNYRKGCLFYGSGFDSVRGTGLRITRARLELSRPSEGGSSAGRPFYLAGHAHATQPGSAPIFTTGTTKVGSWAWGETETADIPVHLAQGLVDGTIRGLGTLYLGTADYAIWRSVSEHATSGRLTLDWA